MFFEIITFVVNTTGIIVWALIITAVLAGMIGRSVVTVSCTREIVTKPVAVAAAADAKTSNADVVVDAESSKKQQ